MLVPKIGILIISLLFAGVVFISVIKEPAYATITMLLTNIIQEISVMINAANADVSPEVGNIQHILTSIAKETERQGKNPEYTIW
jgi:hypothetical protein